jgi:hypothetical protein
MCTYVVAFFQKTPYKSCNYSAVPDLAIRPHRLPSSLLWAAAVTAAAGTELAGACRRGDARRERPDGQPSGAAGDLVLGVRRHANSPVQDPRRPNHAARLRPYEISMLPL